MGVTSKRGIISVNINLDYKSFTTILKNYIQKTFDAIISENQSNTLKNRTILHTFSTIRDVIDVSCKLNSNFALIYLDFR